MTDFFAPEEPDHGDGAATVAVSLAASVPAPLSGERLDRVAAHCFGDFSRTLLRRWIEAGHLLVDGARLKPKQAVYADQRLTLVVPAAALENWHEAQPVPFDLLYEDDDLLVVNKPAGVVVHPGAGNLDQTLVNGLLSHRPALAGLPRAGIVHRLDKDTTGLLLVAASSRARLRLTQMIADREVRRHYLALCQGVVATPTTFEGPIGRDQREPTRMSVRSDGRAARTWTTPTGAYDWATLLEVKLDTGRTHQIRVHLSHAGHALVGDRRYGARTAAAIRAELRGPEAAIDRLAAFDRQALHAAELALEHPVSGAPLTFAVPPPADFQALLDAVPLLSPKIHGQH